MFPTDEVKSYIERYVWRSMQPQGQERMLQAEQQQTQPVDVILTVKWSDPLDFQEVPVREAVARVNDAGFFILYNGKIYRSEPNGGAITLQNRRGLTKTFAGRRARCENGKSISASLAWLRSPNRREYKSIGYWPCNYGRPAKSYNIWQGWGIWAKPGDWSIIDDYILHLTGGDRNKAKFILDWCAQMVQRPWEKPAVALVFKGFHGTSENLLAGILAAVIGQPNALVTAAGKKIFEKFNWNSAGKLLIVADTFSADNEELSKLKQFLTDDEIRVDQKSGHPVQMKSVHRVIINSHHRQIIDVSNYERQIVVCDVSEKRDGDDARFNPLRKAIDGENNALLAAFMHELRTRNISNWKPQEAARELSTLARQKVLALDPPLVWLFDTLERATKDGDPAKIDLSPGTWSLLRERPEMIDSYRAWVRDNRIRRGDDFTKNVKFFPALRRFLNPGNFPGRRLEQKSGTTYRWHMPTREEMKEALNRFLGGEVADEHP